MKYSGPLLLHSSLGFLEKMKASRTFRSAICIAVTSLSGIEERIFCNSCMRFSATVTEKAEYERIELNGKFVRSAMNTGMHPAYIASKARFDLCKGDMSANICQCTGVALVGAPSSNSPWQKAELGFVELANIVGPVRRFFVQHESLADASGSRAANASSRKGSEAFHVPCEEA